MDASDATEILAQSDAYLREFDATVLAADPQQGGIALDRTAFYPGGGGQPADTGSIAGRPVSAVRRQGELVWHFLEGELPQAGSLVHGVLDWERRHKLMRTHTAFHILCGVVWRDYRAQVTGGNMELLQGRMDFEFETLHQELVLEIEEKINREVAAARPVRVRFLPRAEAFQIPDLIRTKINLLPPAIQTVRIVEIEGLDLQADGGTHVANTREVGTIHVAGYKSKGRINKRIELVIDPEPQPGAGHES
ncbi:MAG: alanyl-tRNA editing protein [Spirochaetales bacterium]|nr:alanyl-tRNA editing protein [Spirochaetales bacterium]